MRPKKEDPVKLVTSVITGETALFGVILGALEKRFGPVDLLSEVLDFDYTDYYEKELGPCLKRKIASFEGLVSPGELASIKLFTNGLENKYPGGDGGRRVNIDPGILSLERFVLASCKNFSHRIFLRDGVYADLTLIWREGDFRPLEWTYPDYGSGPMRGILREIRMRYAIDIKRSKDA